MGDAIHLNVQALAAAGTNMVAGYVTGSPDIMWTAADWALFAGKVAVTIDQGYTGSPVPTAEVRDVEPGGWTVAAAVNTAGWVAPRPTIYCSASVLPSLAAAGWRRDVWVANWTGSPPSEPYPVPAGMTCVAVQYTDQGGGGAYDLSVVFDNAWPSGGNVPYINDPVYFQAGWRWCTKCNGLVTITPGPGVCPAGGGHVTAGSFSYQLPNDNTPT